MTMVFAETKGECVKCGSAVKDAVCSNCALAHGRCYKCDALTLFEDLLLSRKRLGRYASPMAEDIVNATNAALGQPEVHLAMFTDGLCKKCLVTALEG
jgi:hypothetical protein